MEFREPLPAGCPPDTAQDIQNPTLKYRLVEGEEPQETDFDSYVNKKGSPIAHSKRTPCEQNGVSLYAKLDAAKMLFKGPRNRDGRWKSIGELTLTPGAGKLNPEEEDGHQTWWPTRDFNPVGNCRLMP